MVLNKRVDLNNRVDVKNYTMKFMENKKLKYFGLQVVLTCIVDVISAIIFIKKCN